MQYSGVKVYKVEQFHPRDSEFVWLQNRLQLVDWQLFAYDIMALSKNILATPSKRLWPIQSSLVGSNRTSRCYQSTISKVFISVRDQCLHFITIKWHQFCSQEHEQKSRIRPSPAQMGRLTDIGSRNIFTVEQVSKKHVNIWHLLLKPRHQDMSWFRTCFGRQCGGSWEKRWLPSRKPLKRLDSRPGRYGGHLARWWVPINVDL